MEAAEASAASAENLRLEGNQAFTEKNWKVAVEKYQESIEVDGKSMEWPYGWCVLVACGSQF